MLQCATNNITYLANSIDCTVLAFMVYAIVVTVLGESIHHEFLRIAIKK